MPTADLTFDDGLVALRTRLQRLGHLIKAPPERGRTPRRYFSTASAPITLSVVER
jgi:hypothetical protein